MASPAYRSKGALLVVTGNGSNLNGSVAVPAGVVDGDFLLLVIRTSNADATPTPPAGWTSITSFAKTSSTQTDMQLYRRTAASEPANYSVSVDGQASGYNEFCAEILAWDSGTYDTSATWEGSGASTTIACPTVTAANADSTLICVYGQYGNAVGAGPYTPPSGMTERTDEAQAFSVGYTSFGVADLAVSAGATGTQNATATNGSTWHFAVSLVIYNSGAAATSLPPHRAFRPANFINL